MNRKLKCKMNLKKGKGNGMDIVSGYKKAVLLVKKISSNFLLTTALKSCMIGNNIILINVIHF